MSTMDVISIAIVQSQSTQREFGAENQMFHGGLLQGCQSMYNQVLVYEN